jgi:hypothetical protein
MVEHPKKDLYILESVHVRDAQISTNMANRRKMDEKGMIEAERVVRKSHQV